MFENMYSNISCDSKKHRNIKPFKLETKHAHKVSVGFDSYSLNGFLFDLCSSQDMLSKLRPHEVSAKEKVISYRQKFINREDQVQPIMLLWDKSLVLDKLLGEEHNNQSARSYIELNEKIHDAIRKTNSLFIADGHHRISALKELSHESKDFLAMVFLAPYDAADFSNNIKLLNFKSHQLKSIFMKKLNAQNLDVSNRFSRRIELHEKNNSWVINPSIESYHCLSMLIDAYSNELEIKIFNNDMVINKQSLSDTELLIADHAMTKGRLREIFNKDVLLTQHATNFVKPEINQFVYQPRKKLNDLKRNNVHNEITTR